jgi:hypothetical protein
MVKLLGVYRSGSSGGLTRSSLEADSQSSHVLWRDITPDTSLSQRIEGEHLKGQRKGDGL